VVVEDPLKKDFNLHFGLLRLLHELDGLGLELGQDGCTVERQMLRDQLNLVLLVARDHQLNSKDFRKFFENSDCAMINLELFMNVYKFKNPSWRDTFV